MYWSGMDGLALCREIRKRQRDEPTYLILLTTKGQAEDVASGLDSGANDYIRKPFDRPELRSRVCVGERMVAAQRELTQKVRQLEEALATVTQLQGLLPICSYCKKIRDDKNYWQRVEAYIELRADVQFSHGICPDRFESIVEPELAQAEAALSIAGGKHMG